MSLTHVLSAVDVALPPRKKSAPKKVSVTPIHPDLATLWNWGRAGEVLGHQVLSTVSQEREEWFWGQVWLSPAEAVSAQKALRKAPEFPATLMPIATDEAGNYTCHDVKSGKLVDWDHETRKPVKLAGDLSKIFTLVTKLAKQEATVELQPIAVVATGALPSAIRAVKSAALRKHSAHFKLHGFEGAAISGDGKLVAGQVYGTSKGCFADLTADKELIPREPAFAQSKKTMGFVIISSDGFAFEGAQLAWRIGEQLSIWSWRTGALALEKGGMWSKADPNFLDVPIRFRGGVLAVAAIVKDTVQVASWAVAQFPAVKSLETAKRELKPHSVISIRKYAGHSFKFDLDQSGAITTLESLEYMEQLLTRFDGKTGKKLESAKVSDVDAANFAVSPDGLTTLLLSREGEVLVFDAKLKLTKRVKTLAAKLYGTAVRFDPSGNFFVVSARDLKNTAGQLAVHDARTFKELAKLPVKDGVSQGFQVRDVSATALVTTSPLAIFTLT